MKTAYKLVNDLKNCKIGVVYSTFNHGILIPSEANRGTDNGIVSSRVKRFMRKIEKGTFFHGIIHVYLNKFGETIDGHNKNRALELMNCPVNFIIVNEEKFNTRNKSDLLKCISNLNNTNTRWNPLEAFRSALKTGEKCAIAIDNIQNEICLKLGIKRSVLTPSRIYSLATSFKGGFNNLTYSYEDYCDDATADIINSPEFNKVLTTVCEIMKISKTFATREWDFVMEMAEKHLKNPLNHNIIDCALEFSYTSKIIEVKQPLNHLTKRTEIRQYLNTL